MSVPLQSNLLLSLAADVHEAVQRFKRSSLESFEAYLTAGGKLVEARGECRRGQWGPFIEAAGVDARTARDMMTLARAGNGPSFGGPGIVRWRFNEAGPEAGGACTRTGRLFQSMLDCSGAIRV